MVSSLEHEVDSWSPYCNALRRPERQVFDGMMQSASELEPKNDLGLPSFQTLLLLILLEQHKRLAKLERRIELGVAKWIQQVHVRKNLEIDGNELRKEAYFVRGPARALNLLVYIRRTSLCFS